MFACGRGGASAANPAVRVLAESGGYKVLTPFNRDFVDALKFEIPSSGRKWEPTSKCWYVSEAHGTKLKELIERHYQTAIELPIILGADNAIFEITFQADYVANCKGGATDTSAASVHCNGGWNARISEKVLRVWFKQAAAAEAANVPQTLYATLGCSEDASPEAIKKAFKRAARQWHPDLCKEPEARDMFEKIKRASEVLLDAVARAKYNAGLFFEKLSKSPNSRRQRVSQYATFIPLLRCGKLTVRARRDLGMLIVEEILSWEDIENEFGQTMVSFWAGDNYSVMWV